MMFDTRFGLCNVAFCRFSAKKRKRCPDGVSLRLPLAFFASTGVSKPRTNPDETRTKDTHQIHKKGGEKRHEKVRQKTRTARPSKTSNLSHTSIFLSI